MAYAYDSKSYDRKVVRVQLPPQAQIKQRTVFVFLDKDKCICYTISMVLEEQNPAIFHSLQEYQVAE